MIIRDDVPRGVQLAQTIIFPLLSAGTLIHAAGQSAQASDAHSASPPTVAVALAASPDELAMLARALAEADVRHVLVHEPDEPWRGALMAIGMVPAPRALVRSFVAHLPLVRGKDDHV